MDPILTRDLHRVGLEVEGMWYNRNQNNEISCSFRVCRQKLGGRAFYLQDQTELLDGYYLTSASENNSKSCFIVFTNMHPFYLT